MKRFSSPQSVDLPPHGITTIESHHATDFSMPESTWPFHKLCWIATGKGSVESGGRSQALRIGDFFYVPENIPHRFVDTPGSPLTLLVICFQDSVVSEPRTMKDVFDHFLSLQSPIQVLTLAQHVQNRIREDFRTLLVEQQIRKTGWPAVTLAVFWNLLVYLTRVIPLRDRDNLQDLFHLSVAHIEEHFFRKLSTSDLAAMCNVSERTYSGLFKKRMGITPTQFILQCRLAFARERLLETENISYAAYESGFSDLAHFYRVFKKETGLPPGKYLAREKSVDRIPNAEDRNESETDTRWDFQSNP